MIWNDIRNSKDIEEFKTTVKKPFILTIHLEVVKKNIFKGDYSI